MSSRLPTGRREMARRPELFTTPATGKAVADVVKTSDGAAWNGDAPSSSRARLQGKPSRMSSRLPTGRRGMATPRALHEPGYRESRRGCRQDFRRGGVGDAPMSDGKAPEDFRRGGVKWRRSELFTSPATGKAVADVVKTSDGAAWNGDAPSSSRARLQGKPSRMSSRLPTGRREMATLRALHEPGYRESRRGCRQDFRRGGVEWRRPELFTSPATGKAVADVVKTSDGAA